VQQQVQQPRASVRRAPLAERQPKELLRLAPKCRRVVLLATTALTGVAMAMVTSVAHAQTWTGATSSDYNTVANWNPNTVPSAGTTAIFTNNAAPTSVNISAPVLPDGFTYNPGAPTYTVTVSGATLTFFGAGIVNNSGNAQNLIASGAGNIQFANSASAGNATISANTAGVAAFFDTASAGTAQITVSDSSSGIQFLVSSSAANATLTATNGASIQFFDTSSGGSSRVVLNSGGILDVITSSGALSIGSLSGNAGRVIFDNGGGAATQSLTVGSLNTSTTFAGALIDGTAVGSLTKVGTGTLTLTGNSTYSGSTTINGGTLEVDGAIGNSSSVTVASGGTLSGTGLVGPTTTTIMSGGALAPGNASLPTGALSINGNLVFQNGALYAVQVAPSGAASTIVSGTATLTGAAVNAQFAPGSYLAKQYTILTASSLGGTKFASLTNVSLPAGFTDSLSYSGSDVFLNLTATLGAGAIGTGGLNRNQRNVATGLNDYFNGGGTLPSNFVSVFGLTGVALANALTQLEGQNATDAQKGAIQLMNQFLNVMLDPTVFGRGDGTGGGGANGFAPQQDATLPSDVALAYATALKAPPPQGFDQRWRFWGAGFGGTSHTNGDPIVGSNDVTASDYGYAAGVDYHVSPDTLYGVALAGGGTNWNLTQGLGGGGSDAFQVGLYGKTHLGPAYLSAAVAFANHWFTTDRTALGDQLHASFTGQTYAGRLEGGYRYAVPIPGAIIGVTPYAAIQSQSFHTPSYSESDLTGSGFGLSYASMNTTDTRSEFGARFDNLQIVNGMPLVLRGRLAWGHDWFDNATALNAVFQSLPGSNFTVFGAAPPKDSALTTVAAELHMTANWALTAKFDGEFGSGSQLYAGTGTLRYTW
jgi:autotransporter-associated beta strand protein